MSGESGELDDLDLPAPMSDKSASCCGLCGGDTDEEELHSKSLHSKTTVAKWPWCLLVLGLILGLLCLAVGLSLFYALEPFIRSQIKNKVVISNKSDIYEVWQDIPVPVYMQFWLFNVTNVADVLTGLPPRVVQMGPYTYRERRQKYDIVWNHNNTVTYKQNRTFTYIPEMSFFAWILFFSIFRVN